MSERPPHEYVPEGPLETAPEGGFRNPQERREAFAAVLSGVETGAYDRRITDWLAGLDDTTCRTVASLLWRERLAGRAEGAQPPALGYVLAVRDADGTLQPDPHGYLYPDLAEASEGRGDAQAWADSRKAGDRWLVARLTEVPETEPREDEDDG